MPILTGFQGAVQAPESETDERSQATRQRANPDGQRTRNLKGEEYMDFNDLHVLEGLEEVKRQLVVQPVDKAA